MADSTNPIDILIADLQSTAVNVAVQEVMSYLVANVWVGLGSAFLSPIVGWLVGIVLDILMQKLDWLAFMLVEDWQTTQEGITYANAAQTLANLPPTASAADIAQAQAAKIAAFKNLVGLGSPQP